MTQQTAMTTFKYAAPSEFGSGDEINAIIERMEALVPVVLTDQQRNDVGLVRRLNNAYLKTAQLCVFYKLIPGQDVHILPFGGQFSVHIGVEAWKKAADRYCALHGLTYQAVYEELTTEEMQERRGDLYTPEDVGAVCYLWRSDKQAVYELFGGKNAITKGFGHWAKKARYDKYKKAWEPDQIPVQRTRQDVARRRAFLHALRSEFSLDSLLASTPADIREQLQWLDRDASSRLIETSPNTPQRMEQADEEGIYLVTTHPAQRAAVPMEHADGEMPEDIPYLDEPQATEEEPFDELRYIADSLTGRAATLLNWSRQQEEASQGPADLAAYQMLVGEISRHIGKGNHTLLLAVLLGRSIDKEQRPGERFTRFLLSFLPQQIDKRVEGGQPVQDDQGNRVKVDNPRHNAEFVLAIKEAWDQIGQFIDED